MYSKRAMLCFRHRQGCFAAALIVAAAVATPSSGSATTPGPQPQSSQTSRSATGTSAQLEKNKRLAEAFFLDVFGKQDPDAAARYLRNDYIQHNPNVPAGLKGFQDYFRDQFAKLTPEAREALKVEVLHTVAEGDLVVIHLRISGKTSKGEPFAHTEFNLFRVEGGLLAEHWDASP